MTTKQWVLSHFIFVLILGLSLSQFFEIKEQKASLTFLDIGQGDSILIETEDGKNILIDAGPDGKIVDQLSSKLNFFNQKIDLFILTHPHVDHYGGILDVMQKYPVKTVMLTGIASEDPMYLSFIRNLKSKQIPIIYPTSEKDLQLSKNLYLDFLYPFKGMSLIGQEVKNKNNNSTSLRLLDKTGKGLALLTGDAEKEQERELLLSGQAFSATIFKLGHHGSKTSSNPEFLKAIKAERFVISLGKDNKFGHPNQEVLDRLTGKEVHRTDQEGSITFMLE